jgi:hypothetical protein
VLQTGSGSQGNILALELNPARAITVFRQISGSISQLPITSDLSLGFYSPTMETHSGDTQELADSRQYSVTEVYREHLEPQNSRPWIFATKINPSSDARLLGLAECSRQHQTRYLEDTIYGPCRLLLLGFLHSPRSLHSYSSHLLICWPRNLKKDATPS